MAACIAGEAGSVLDLAFWQPPGMEYSKGVSSEAKACPLSLEVTTFQGHPAQRLLAAPAQERAFLLLTGFGVLLANGIDRPTVQREFLATSSGQLSEIETGRPTLIPLQRVLLSVVAEIPDKIAGARLRIQQAN